MSNVCIVGLGRVGLPLALSLEDAGHKVVGVDTNPEVQKAIQNGMMPFDEPGYDALIKKSQITISDPDNYPDADIYIVTVGTPLKQHIETDLSNVMAVVDRIINQGKVQNKLLILRSTVAPKTTEILKTHIQQKTNFAVGKDFFLAMCPERLAEGKAKDELTWLPQIVGAFDSSSTEKASELFKTLGRGVEIHACLPIEAELSKLFCNIYRYINFSIPNYFTYLASTFNVDVFSLFRTMNTNYPRNNGLKMPGFAAGTCLRKDFGMINESFPQTDLLLQAYKINEFMPKFYADLVGDKMVGKTVGILGYTMKSNTDDTRDSLVPKLIQYINRYSPFDILISDPNLPGGSYNDKFNCMSFDVCATDEVIENTEIVFIAMNHDEYKSLDKNTFKGKLVVDIWGMLSDNIVMDFRG
jgi:UDP-N-acetyl-D-mannosaminuronic acid dehydrogenase